MSLPLLPPPLDEPRIHGSDPDEMASASQDLRQSCSIPDISWRPSLCALCNLSLWSTCHSAAAPMQIAEVTELDWTARMQLFASVNEPSPSPVLLFHTHRHQNLARSSVLAVTLRIGPESLQPARQLCTCQAARHPTLGAQVSSAGVPPRLPGSASPPAVL